MILCLHTTSKENPWGRNQIGGRNQTDGKEQHLRIKEHTLFGEKLANMTKDNAGFQINFINKNVLTNSSLLDEDRVSVLER